MNTGTATKIMRDSSVSADLDDVSSRWMNERFDQFTFLSTDEPDNRLNKIPVVRRTIIVEPYPAQPTSQIIVKPRSDMIGKVTLSRDPNVTEKEEQIVYPTSISLSGRQPRKKKTKLLVVNDNVIENLDLEDVSADDRGFDQSLFMKSSKASARKTIRNAFYN